ncbi:carbohydrate-binding protein [Paenibacillus psychroresistens]|uniref:Carbohydrate-binding protein n=1 Tax=Paenibacillus psychroresistens TaxID=1778678 RepID=A0A6B8RU28_9BACL|nr:carbohydrate-binding protein [Paenibacillus psychroresistens]QGQ98963.1 carbohydrate-binding protein [Paenibacillus psychroresistens]
MKKSLMVLALVMIMVVSSASLAFAAISPYDKISPSENTDLNSDTGKHDDGKGPRIEENDKKNLGYIKAGNYAKFGGIDFGAEGASKVKVEAATPNAAGEIAFVLDDPKGAPFATVKYESSGDWQKYVWSEADVTGVTGVHDLYVVFISGDVNVGDIQFVKASGGAEAAVPAADNPKTGDAGVMLYVLLAAGSAALLFSVRKSFIKQS